MAKNGVDDGYTALHAAADFGHGDVAQLLLDSGADVDAKIEQSEWTPLGCACVRSRLLEWQAPEEKKADGGARPRAMKPLSSTCCALGPKSTCPPKPLCGWQWMASGMRACCGCSWGMVQMWARLWMGTWGRS